MPTQQDRHSYAAGLRERAQHLSELARQIEASLVMSLPDEIVRESTSRKGQLCERMLNANLHQLHVAAEDLRATAHTFQKQAAVHAKDEQAAA